jgi:sigma-54 dependent transcriptional regulator, acetoin dehydrogenase operon transcriptional activator AcoR
MQALSSRTTKAIWTHYVERNHLDPQSLRREVASSWQRCRDIGVDPFRTIGGEAQRLELRQRIEQRRHLMEMARPFIANLYNFVRGSGFQVVLADHDGILLEVIGDSEIQDKTRPVQLCAGGNWSEEARGTNAIGTVLIERKPVQIHAWEHYCQPHHFLTCSAAPIFDPEGEMLGVLDITGDYRQANTHTLGMVVAAANAIENQLRLHKTTTSLYLAYRYSTTLIESMSDGLISVDTSGIITEINNPGGRLLGVHPQTAKGQHINTVLKQSAPMLQLLDSGREYRDREILLDGQGGRTILSSATLLHDDNGDVIGAMAVLRDAQSGGRNVTTTLAPRYTFADITGSSVAISEARQWAELAAAMPSTVLLAGESGTGKELFAQAIHNASPRKRAPFVALNCAALPETLIESELFGYEEGTFTGARKGGQAGKFELADGGTVFLDEIGDMPAGVQAKLLRVIQERKVARLGAVREQTVNIRIIAATHKDLAAEVRAGRFREDLYYRLNVVAIRIPALRERRADVPELAEKLIQRLGVRLGYQVRVDADFFAALSCREWPGNVRELENVLERVMLRAGADGRLTVALLDQADPALPVTPGSAPPPAADVALRSLREVERDAIVRAVARHDGNIQQAAATLGIGRNTLYRKLKEYDLAP